ncbi:MAG: hypothetical protein B7Z57_11610 [Acidiphilium sp. 37-60-79]|nr:MAG: hypothetical protein B7Z57_11610 [Acidiphilium sp. 37-60-79]OZB40861.1 MAG: hypothetical protein B7X48_03280 [Acidiphilium sp. 34-60-192]
MSALNALTIGARSERQVLDDLLAIAPPGDAMPTTPDTVFAQMLMPWANELSLVETLMLAFRAEINPLTAVNLLPDYERVLGPDPYGRDQQPLTQAEQQALTYSRWVTRFGVRAADFVAFAATFGVVISIQQYRVTTAGAFAGVDLVNAPTQFDWLVTLPSAVETLAEASAAQAGNLVSSFPPSLVVPAILGRAPAQTTPYFSYVG